MHHRSVILPLDHNLAQSGGTGLLPRGGAPGHYRQHSLLLPRIESRIGFAQQALNRFAVFGINGNTRADGKLGSLFVIGKAFADATGHPVGGLCVGLRQHQDNTSASRQSAWLPTICPWRSLIDFSPSTSKSNKANSRLVRLLRLISESSTSTRQR